MIGVIFGSAWRGCREGRGKGFWMVGGRGNRGAARALRLFDACAERASWHLSRCVCAGSTCGVADARCVGDSGSHTHTRTRTLTHTHAHMADMASGEGKLR